MPNRHPLFAASSELRKVIRDSIVQTQDIALPELGDRDRRHREVSSWSLMVDSTDLREDGWSLDTGTKVGNIPLDLYFSTTLRSHAGLYNPLANSDAFGGPPHYFTTAILTVTFDADTSLQVVAGESPFVRMQNVGLDGEGSLKLVPDASIMFLLGSALIGLFVLSRRKSKT